MRLYRGNKIIIPSWRYKNKDFQIQRQPNSWSCFPAAFAIALNISVKDLIEELGHDGSEIIRPNKPEPYCFKGWHPQEFYKICLKHGYTVTPFDVEPLNYDGETIIKMDSDLNYILRMMSISIGVIGGYFAPGKLHSVAWDGRYILNPADELIYTLDHFTIETFYLMKRLK